MFSPTMEYASSGVHSAVKIQETVIRAAIMKGLNLSSDSHKKDTIGSGI